MDISEIKSKLTPGNYTLVVVDNAFNSNLSNTYREFVASGVTPVDIRTHFLNRNIQSDQTDTYTVNLNGEQFMWFVWEKVLSEQPYPYLDIILYDSNDKMVRSADAQQGTAVLYVGDLRGTYDLKIWSARPAQYAFGIENPDFGSYSLATLQNYVLEDSLEGIETKAYTITFPDNLLKVIDISFVNKTANMVKIKINVDDVEQPEFLIAAGQRDTCSITLSPQGDQKKSTLCIQASGKVSYTIDMDYSQIEAKVVKDTLIFNPTKLVYLQGNTAVNWKKVDANATGKYLYWDYETLPLVVKKELINKTADEKSYDYIKLDRWELAPIEGVTQNGESGNKHILEPINEGAKAGEHNAIIIFKDQLKNDRLMVKWLYDGAAPLKVGTLRGYQSINGKDSLVIEEDLYVNRINLDELWTKSSHKAKVPWFQEAYDNIALARGGVEWVKVWAHDGKEEDKYYYTEQTKTSSCTIPLQMLIGQVGQETSYGTNMSARYEPFKDAYYFGERHYIEGYIAGKLVEKYPSYVITDESKDFTTIFDYFWPLVGNVSKFKASVSSEIAQIKVNSDQKREYWVKLNPFSEVSSYPNRLWLSYPLKNNNFRSTEGVIVAILNNTNLEKEVRIKKSKKFFEILLNYGPYSADWWYNNGMNDKDDPTCFAFIWDKIGVTYNLSATSEIWNPEKWPNKPTITNMKKRFEKLHEDGLTRDNRRYSEIYLEIFINYGKQRANDWDNNYYKKSESSVKELYDPTRIQYIWDRIGSKYKVNDTLEVCLNPNSTDNSYSPKQWLQNDECDYIKNLKKNLDDFIVYLNNKNKLQTDEENTLVCKVLEYLIKYGKDETQKWINLITSDNYSIPTHGYYDPEMSSTSYDEKIIKPFIAQTILSSSYGHLQVLVTSAYMAGFLKREENDLSYLINDPFVAFEYGVRFLSTEKMWLGFNSSGIKELTRMQKVDTTKWVQFWDQILKEYNGASSYPGEVREKEVEFFKKVGFTNE